MRQSLWWWMVLGVLCLAVVMPAGQAQASSGVPVVMTPTLGLMPVLGLSWFAEAIMEAVAAVVDFISEVFEEWTGIDFDGYVVAPVVSFCNTYIVAWSEVVPLIECITILIGGWAVAMGIRVGRYVIGWIPGVDG